MENVERQDDIVTISWNPDVTVTQTGSLALKFRFENLNSGTVITPTAQWDGVSRVRFKSLGSSRWRLTVFIDDTIAFSGPI